VQHRCGLLYPDGVAEYNSSGLRLGTVLVQRISGRGAVAAHVFVLYIFK
jgi:hypothetical protein